MNAEIKAGKNWHMFEDKNQGTLVPSEGFKMPVNNLVGLENPKLGAHVQVKIMEHKVQVPAPIGITPDNATGEGVVVSQLKDEEGGIPQEFLNLHTEGAWITFFEGAEDDYLAIKLKQMRIVSKRKI